MPLDYALDTNLIALTTFSRKFMSWGADCFAQDSYLHKNTSFDPIDEDFNAWLQNVKSMHTIPSKAIIRLEELYQDTKASCKKRTILPAAFNAIIQDIVNIEKDLLIAASGIDVITGLRHRCGIEKHIDTEMERLARDGKTFSIAFVQMAGFEALKKECDVDEELVFEKQIADLVKTTLRTFDEAFYLGDGQFLLILKLAESAGGVKAVERLKDELEKKNIKIQTSKGSEGFISLICRVAEPVAGDDAQDIIENLKADVENSGEDINTVFEYKEMSPLQRFVQDNH